MDFFCLFVLKLCARCGGQQIPLPPSFPHSLGTDQLEGLGAAFHFSSSSIFFFLFLIFWYVVSFGAFFVPSEQFSCSGVRDPLSPLGVQTSVLSSHPGPSALAAAASRQMDYKSCAELQLKGSRQPGPQACRGTGLPAAGKVRACLQGTACWPRKEATSCVIGKGREMSSGFSLG